MLVRVQACRARVFAHMQCPWTRRLAVLARACAWGMLGRLFRAIQRHPKPNGTSHRKYPILIHMFVINTRRYIGLPCLSSAITHASGCAPAQHSACARRFICMFMLNTRVRARRGLRVPPELRGRASTAGGCYSVGPCRIVRACVGRARRGRAKAYDSGIILHNQKHT
eukprot:4931508-Pleurochrysis_carterae.AAC.5